MSNHNKYVAKILCQLNVVKYWATLCGVYYATTSGV